MYKIKPKTVSTWRHYFSSFWITGLDISWTFSQNTDMTQRSLNLSLIAIIYSVFHFYFNIPSTPHTPSEEAVEKRDASLWPSSAQVLDSFFLLKSRIIVPLLKWQPLSCSYLSQLHSNLLRSHTSCSCINMSSAPPVDAICSQGNGQIPKSVWAMWMEVFKAGNKSLSQIDLQTLVLAYIC